MYYVERYLLSFGTPEKELLEVTIEKVVLSLWEDERDFLQDDEVILWENERDFLQDDVRRRVWILPLRERA